MWPFSDKMVIEAKGDSREVPILWGPTLFYAFNILVQFLMVIGFCLWMGYSYYREREETSNQEQESGDKKSSTKDKKSESAQEKARKTEKPKAKQPKQTDERTNVLNRETPRAQATVSDEVLSKKKSTDPYTDDEDASQKRTSSSEQLLNMSVKKLPKSRSTRATRSSSRTKDLQPASATPGANSATPGANSATPGASSATPGANSAISGWADDSESELADSEYSVTPGMSVRRRRSKRLLEIVQADH